MASTSTLAPPAAPTPGLINSAGGGSSAPTATSSPPGLINAAPGSSTTTTGTSPVQSGQPVTSYNPATATASTATATPYTVTPGMTVAGQLHDILSSGSPLLQKATADANNAMNARGLENSSQAITAGETGLINTALPIATSDAGTMYGAMTSTGNAQNAASLANSQLKTQNEQFNAGQTNASLSSAATASNTQALAELQAQNQQALQTLVGSQQLAAIDAQGTIQTNLTKLTTANQQILQTSQGAAGLYNTYLQYMAGITQNLNMTPDQKANSLNDAVTSLNDSLDTLTNIAGQPGVQSTLNFADNDFGGTSPLVTASNTGS